MSGDDHGWQTQQDREARAAQRNLRLLGILVLLLLALAAFGIACIFYGLFSRCANAIEWVMAGNALVFSGLTALLILLNISLVRAQGIHTHVAINPAVTIFPYFVAVDENGIARVPLINNSSAPAHHVKLTVWPLVPRQTDPPFEVGSGLFVYVGEMMPFAQRAAILLPRQPALSAADDLTEGTTLRQRLDADGYPLQSSTFIWELEWSDALYQSHTFRGSLLPSLDVPSHNGEQ